jgi:hypothetical protein
MGSTFANNIANKTYSEIAKPKDTTSGDTEDKTVYKRDHEDVPYE